MPPDLIVHLLWYGLPLCRFNTGLPSNWPEGHRWVGLNDDDKTPVNCPECVRLLTACTEIVDARTSR
jgi:hypothetical protein